MRVVSFVKPTNLSIYQGLPKGGNYSTRTVNAKSEYSQQGWCGVCLCGLGKGWLRGGVREEGGGRSPLGRGPAARSRRPPSLPCVYPVSFVPEAEPSRLCVYGHCVRSCLTHLD